MPDTKTSHQVREGPDHRQGLDRRRASRDAGERQGAQGRVQAQPGGRAGRRRSGDPARRSPTCRSPIGRWPKRIHELVTTTAPALVPKTYYGMPAYAKDGKTDLLLQAQVEVQGALCDVRLPAGRRARRRRHVAGRVRGDEADPGGGEADRRAREEGRGLTLAGDWGAIEVRGARENNLRNVSLDIPKRRLTAFTGVSGSGKSSLVFGTIAAESQRLINETYSAFVQGFMPTLARPDVDSLEGLTTAIILDQERMGANVRSTVGTVTDANAMLRVVFSRIGQPHIGGPQAYSFNVPSVSGAGAVKIERGAGQTESRELQRRRRHVPALRGHGHRDRRST